MKPINNLQSNFCLNKRLRLLHDMIGYVNYAHSYKFFVRIDISTYNIATDISLPDIRPDRSQTCIVQTSVNDRRLYRDLFRLF